MIKDGNGRRTTAAQEDREAYERFVKKYDFAAVAAIGLRKFLEAHIRISGPSYEWRYIDDWLALHPEDDEIYRRTYAEAERKAAGL